VIVWFPTASDEVVKLALPPESVAVPRVTAPSTKLTVPVGVPEAGATAVTVATNVADWPNTVGFKIDETVAELLALLTVCVMAAEVPVAKLLSPP
jgi:hypothetical protein